MFGRNKKKITIQDVQRDQRITGNEFSVADGEGRISRHIHPIDFVLWSGLFFIALVVIFFWVAQLQIVEGAQYRTISENNIFEETIVFSERGEIYDRHGTKIAWNELSSEGGISQRRYLGEGMGSLLGFITYPQQDTHGKYYQEYTVGQGGLEEIYDGRLVGKNGALVIEENALGEITSKLHILKPVSGESVTVSIDATAQQLLYEAIEEVTQERDFDAGAGVLLNVKTGEILGLVSAPDFDNNILTGLDVPKREALLQNQEQGLFIHRAVSGLYIPGSTVKPFFAVAALAEEVIRPTDVIVSNGAITLKNLYNPEAEDYVFRDRKAFGPLNLYGALAQSSNVYFYYIGGGYGHIKDALGIDRIKFYARVFGLGRPTTLGIFSEPAGLVPDAEWKKSRYESNWTIGDTYNTVIGQYAFQTTPLQLARGLGAIANGGELIEPHFKKDIQGKRTKLAIEAEYLEVARVGMRRAVLEGTAQTLFSQNYQLAAKTGTAQRDDNDNINSLAMGFFPYDNPTYAFVIVMENGEDNGAALAASRRFFDHLHNASPEYTVGLTQ